MEATHFTLRRGHKKHLRPKLTANIKVGNGFIQFQKEATPWLGVWRDAHLTFKEHLNRCMTKARAAEAQLCVLTKMHSIVLERVKAVQIACVQTVLLYGSELWCDPREIGRREDFQLLLNWQCRSTLGSLPTMPTGAPMRESGLTPAPVAPDARQQQFTARLASACEGSKLQAVHNHPTSGAPMCRVIIKEPERGWEADTMRWPNPEEDLAVNTVILSEDPAAKR